MIAALIVFAPLLRLGEALLSGLMLFWPAMLLFGAVHSHLSWVPALGWWPTALVIALLSVILPSGSSADASS